MYAIRSYYANCLRWSSETAGFLPLLKLWSIEEQDNKTTIMKAHSDNFSGKRPKNFLNTVKLLIFWFEDIKKKITQILQEAIPGKIFSWKITQQKFLLVNKAQSLPSACSIISAHRRLPFYGIKPALWI